MELPVRQEKFPRPSQMPKMELTSDQFRNGSGVGSACRSFVDFTLLTRQGRASGTICNWFSVRLRAGEAHYNEKRQSNGNVPRFQ